MNTKPQNFAYRGTAFLAAILDLPARQRRHALTSVEAEDFVTKAHRIIFTSMLEMKDLDSIDGFENTHMALLDHLLATGALSGDLEGAVNRAMLDIATTKVDGFQAFELAVSLRDDTYRTALEKFGNGVTKNARTAPKDVIHQHLNSSLDSLRYLERRTHKDWRPTNLKAVS